MGNWNSEFERKLIQELHDISLSLKEISGRNIIDSSTKQEKPKSYAERYFERSNPDKKD